MIVSKPVFRTISSMVIFLIFAYILVALMLYFLIQGSDYFWFLVIAIVSTLAFVLPLNFRIFLNYKIIQAGKGQLRVNYKFLSRKQVFKLKDMEEFEEEEIKTFNDIYRSLWVKFPNGYLKLNNQEYDNYDKLKSYLDKNRPRRLKK